MGRRSAGRRVEEFVLFDFLYEDGSRTSNRKVPGLELGGVDGDIPAISRPWTGKLQRSPENPGLRSSR